MYLNKVSFQQVQADLDNDTPENFNTSFHTAQDAPFAIIPVEKPYSFKRWLPLILESRGIPRSSLQVVSLSRSQARVIVDASKASIQTRVFNRSYAEDLEDEVYPAFSQLAFPSEGLFMRLEACSPKDGAQSVPGRQSLHSLNDIVLRLITSQRSCNSLIDILDGPSQEIRVFFLPFDAAMRAEKEYRVFCMPRTLRITAISQYKWHKPWIFGNRNEDEMEVITRAILLGVQRIHHRIIERLRRGSADELDHLIWLQGFSFDVLYSEENHLCTLIELNTFGIRSACGSCLFQWVKDRQVLYGMGNDDVEFRVAF